MWKLLVPCRLISNFVSWIFAAFPIYGNDHIWFPLSSDIKKLYYFMLTRLKLLQELSIFKTVRKSNIKFQLCKIEKFFCKIKRYNKLYLHTKCNLNSSNNKENNCKKMKVYQGFLPKRYIKLANVLTRNLDFYIKSWLPGQPRCLSL